MEWNAAENRANLISRSIKLLVDMNVVNESQNKAVQKVIDSFMGWAIKNQPVISEQGRYEEAPQDSCLRLFVAFLTWISGASLRAVIGEIQKLYLTNKQKLGSSIFNFESFAENLTWKVLFLISLIRASKEQILPASSTFNAVRFVHRSRFGCTENAIPLLFKNKFSSPPLNRVQVHALLSNGFTSAEIALGKLDGRTSLGRSSERKIQNHVRNFIKDSFHEVSRQFSYLASGTGLNKANEDISKEYWFFAIQQINSLLTNARHKEAIWAPSSIEEKTELSRLIEPDETEGQLILTKSFQGIEIELYSPDFESDDSDQIRVVKTDHFSTYFSFGDHIDLDMANEKLNCNAIIVDFPWTAGVTANSSEFCRLSPAAFGILISLCARKFVGDVGIFVNSIISSLTESPIGVRELYALSEPHLKRGVFPETLFESWAKYIEVGEF